MVRQLKIPAIVSTSIKTFLNWLALAKPENSFLVIALFFGLIFTVVTAPFQVPDEYDHFFRAFEISQGRPFGLTARIPRSVIDFTHDVSQNLPGNIQNKQSKKALFEELFRHYEGTPLITVDVASLATYSPIPYLPQALGILVGRLLMLPPLLILYLARLINLFVWFFLVYEAIRLTPFHPRLFSALALMPMSLFLAASCSLDTFTNGISFLWLACALRLFIRPTQVSQTTDWVLVVLLAIPLALCKSIYILLTLVLLLIPLRFKDRRIKNCSMAVGIILLSALVSFGLIQATSNFIGAKSTTQYGMPSILELRFLFLHPTTSAVILVNSFREQFFFLTKSMVGILGWLDTPLPGWIYPTFYLLLVFVAFLESHPRLYLKIYEIIWNYLIVLAGLLIMILVYFHPQLDVPKGKISIITQGRYFIPFAPLVFFSLSQKKWSVPERSWIWGIVVLLQFVVLGITLRVLLGRYYAI